MATVATTNYGFGKPQIGGSLNLWGTEWRTALDDIDTEIKRVADIKSSAPVPTNHIANPCFRLHNRFGSSYTMGSDDIAHVIDGWDYKEEDSLAATTTIARYEIQTNLLNQGGYNNITPYGARFDMEYSGNTNAVYTVAFRTPIKGFDLPNFLGDSNATLSFMAKYPTVGTYSVALTTWNGVDTTTSLSYIVDFSISSVNWQKVTVKIPMTTTLYTTVASTGSADLDIEIHKANFLNIVFPLSVRTDRQATSGTWHNTSTGQFVSTNHANTIKTFSSGLNNQWVYWTQIKFEPGNTATAFINLPIYKEVENCQRFIETSMNLNTGRGVAASLGVIARHYFGNTTTGAVSDSWERKITLSFTASDPGRTVNVLVDTFQETGSSVVLAASASSEKNFNLKGIVGLGAVGGTPQNSADYRHYVAYLNDAFTS